MDFRLSIACKVLDSVGLPPISRGVLCCRFLYERVSLVQAPWVCRAGDLGEVVCPSHSAVPLAGRGSDVSAVVGFPAGLRSGRPHCLSGRGCASGPRGLVWRWWQRQPPHFCKFIPPRTLPGSHSKYQRKILCSDRRRRKGAI